uniref:Uncharacterized protein n=1 Tax=Opuntia streptacantha TaxID=393608 RepID=A0A7C8Z495_OPUST
MCSVLHSPIPSAPFFLAFRASSGVSAFAMTLRVRISSTQDMKVSKSPLRAGGERASFPKMTSPVDPFSESQSPSFITISPTLRTFSVLLTRISEHPATQHLPQPRATTAAWDVMPPFSVKIPAAACIPPTSSGLVSALTKMTSFPSACHPSASSAVKTTCPTAAPGDAGKPVAITLSL